MPGIIVAWYGSSFRAASYNASVRRSVNASYAGRHTEVITELSTVNSMTDCRRRLRQWQLYLF